MKQRRGLKYRRGLPPLLADIADIVSAATGDPAAGVAAALELARLKGGQQVHIPTQAPPPDHWLSQIVGPVAAKAICEHYRVLPPRDGGELSDRFRGALLDIPVGPRGSYNAQRRARAEAYRKAAAEALSANETAVAIGVTRRAVFKARRDMRERQERPDLFSKLDRPR